jgi:hypothetical protein
LSPLASSTEKISLDGIDNFKVSAPAVQAVSPGKGNLPFFK